MKELSQWQWIIKTLCDQYEEANRNGAVAVEILTDQIIAWGHTERYIKAIEEQECDEFASELRYAYTEPRDYKETVKAEGVADGSYFELI